MSATKVRAQGNMAAPAESREGGRAQGAAAAEVDRESDDGKVFSGREGSCPHAASSEDTRKTSLAKAEGGKLVTKTDRAPEKSLECQAGSIGLPPGHRGPSRLLSRRCRKRRYRKRNMMAGPRTSWMRARWAGKAPGLRLCPNQGETGAGWEDGVGNTEWWLRSWSQLDSGSNLALSLPAVWPWASVS